MMHDDDWYWWFQEKAELVLLSEFYAFDCKMTKTVAFVHEHATHRGVRPLPIPP